MTKNSLSPNQKRTLVIALLSLIISGVSCYFSWKANQISQMGHDTAEQSLSISREAVRVSNEANVLSSNANNLSFEANALSKLAIRITNESNHLQVCSVLSDLLRDEKKIDPFTQLQTDYLISLGNCSQAQQILSTELYRKIQESAQAQIKPTQKIDSPITQYSSPTQIYLVLGILGAIEIVSLVYFFTNSKKK